MTKAAAPHRWFSGWRAPRAAAESDPADLGTCFGLEMSLDDSLPAAPRAAAAPVRRTPAWVRRLTTRRRSG